MNWIYEFCTDFIINLANLTGLSYYEVNLFVFCFLFPMLVIGLLMRVVFQLRVLRKTKQLG